MDSTSRNASKPAKRAACDRCHVLKSRCSRSAGKNEICDRCRRLGIECVSSAPLRTGRPRGSGIGLVQNAASEKGTNNTSAPPSLRKSKTPDAGTWANSPRHTSPESQTTLGRHDRQQSADLGAALANMNFTSFSAAQPNLVDSDFSGSSLDGKSLFDINSFTPMTTRSDDLAMEQPPLPFHDSSWQSLSTSAPNIDHQQLSRSGSFQNIAHAHQLSRDSSMYNPTQNPTFDEYRSNYPGILTDTSYVQDHQQPENIPAVSGSHLAIISAEIYQLHSLASMSSGTDPLILLEETFKVTKRLIDTLAALTSTASSTNLQSSQMGFLPGWNSTEANYLTPVATNSNYMRDARAGVSRSIRTQVASTYMCLIHIYKPMVAYLDQRLRSTNNTETATFQSQMWMPHITENMGSASLQELESRYMASSSSGATRTRLLLLIMLGILQRLHTTIHSQVSLFDQPSSERFAMPIHRNPQTNLGLQSMHSTLGQLFSEEQNLLNNLKSIVDSA